MQRVPQVAKSDQKAHQEDTRRGQGIPKEDKRDPKGSQETAKGTQRAAKSPQKRPQRHPKGDPRRPSGSIKSRRRKISINSVILLPKKTSKHTI